MARRCGLRIWAASSTASQNDKNLNFYYDANSPQGTVAIQMAVFKQPGTNAVQVVDGIKAMLPRLAGGAASFGDMYMLFDRSVTIRNSVNDVKFTLELALFLVIMVIFLFLRNISATTIPSLALPFSLVGTFAVMYLGGYSLDNLSLMALTLSVGFVVDDAIVMLENIVRHMEHGEDAMEAAINGSGEIGFTILSMTLSLSAVFHSRVVHGRSSGPAVARIRRDDHVGDSGVRLRVSDAHADALQPLPETHHEVKHGRLYNFFESMQVGLERAYDRCLQVVLRHKLATMVVSAGAGGRHVLSRRDHSEGLSAERGYRPDQWDHRGHRRNFL